MSTLATPAPARAPARSRLVARSADKSDASSHGRAVSGSLWPKLAVSRPDDPAEREADRIAREMVTAGPDRIAPEAADRSCDDCDPSAPCQECAAKSPQIQRAAASVPAQAPRSSAGPGGGMPELGPGRPLDPESRREFEPKFGTDFSGVRVHTGREAADAAAAFAAHAFTVGSDISFAVGRYAPRAAVGRQLLAHELSHVVQQSWDQAPMVQRVGAADPPMGYFEAERELRKRAEAEEQAARERHERWVASHQAGHAAFLAQGPSNIAQDIATTSSVLVAQRVAMLNEAARLAAAPSQPGVSFPGAFGSLAFSARPPVTSELTDTWVSANQEVILVQALTAAEQLTPEDAAMARFVLVGFYRALLPLAEADDRAEQDRQQLNEAVAAASRQPAPCPNCHTPNPASFPVHPALPPMAPGLRESFELLSRAETVKDWRDVVARFASSTAVMDGIVMARLSATSRAVEGFTFARDLLQRQQNLQARFPDAIRIRAVFYPEDKFVKAAGPDGKDVEIANGIPWYFYLTHTPTKDPYFYPSGFSWVLRDITSPQRPEVSYELSAVENFIRSYGRVPVERPPPALFDKLNNKLVFPKGMLYWVNPDNTPGELQTTEPHSLSDWLGFIGLGLAGLAIILASGGLASGAVITGLGVAAAGFSVASTLADLQERSELGILTREDEERAALLIAADIASVLSLGLGKLAAAATEAAAATGQVTRMTIIIQRAATVAETVDKLLGKVVVLKVSTDLIRQFQAIIDSNLPPAERDAALKDLSFNALLTGAMIAAPHLLGPGKGRVEEPAAEATGGIRESVRAPSGDTVTVVRTEAGAVVSPSRVQGDSEFLARTSTRERLTPDEAAHELQIGQREEAGHPLTGDREFSEEVVVGDHRWKKQRSAGGGWCRFSTKVCYTPGQLKVGPESQAERITVATLDDVTRLRGEMSRPPSSQVRTVRDRLDWTDYSFYTERRLRMIEDAIRTGKVPPAPPLTFRSFREAYPEGHVVRNDIRESWLRGPLDATGRDAAKLAALGDARTAFASVLARRPGISGELAELENALASATKVNRPMASKIDSLRARLAQLHEVDATSRAPGTARIVEVSADKAAENYYLTTESVVPGPPVVLEFPDGSRIWRDTVGGPIRHEATLGAAVGRAGMERGMYTATGHGRLPPGPKYQRAHSLGQGTGFESPYGVLYAPEHVNQTLQNHGIEAYMRDLAAKAAPGERFRVLTATTSHPDTSRLAAIDYTIVRIAGGRVEDVATYAIRVTSSAEHPLVTADAIHFSPTAAGQAVAGRVPLPEVLTKPFSFAY